ncbi:MAG: discoidin domain-containing protein [Verrucomicrobiota bacterium]
MKHTVTIATALLLASPARAAILGADDVRFLVERNVACVTNPVAYKAGEQMNRCMLLGNGGIEAAVSSPDGAAENIRVAIHKNDYWRDHLLAKGSSANAKGHYAPNRTVNVNPGYMDLRFPDFGGAAFRQEQDMWNAEVRTTLRKGEQTVCVTATIPKPAKDVIVQRIENRGLTPVRVVIDTFTKQVSPTNDFLYDLDAGVATNGDCVAWVKRRTPLGERVVTLPEECSQFRMWAAVATRLLGATVSSRVAEGRVTLSAEIPPGQTATVVTVVRGTGIPLTLDPADPLPAALVAAAKLTAGELERLATGHRAWWVRFWNHSRVRLDAEPLVERVYYGALYVFGCVNKPGEYASGCNSFGVEDSPMWTGDYHWNYNIQAPYYLAWSSDRVELSEPYDRAVREHDVPLGRAMAKRAGAKGTFFCIGTAPGGQINENTSGYGHRSNALQAALNQVDHYLFTLDQDWLWANFEFLKAVAAYWDDDLLKHKEMRPNGSYRYNITANAPLEGCGGSLNATPTIGFLQHFYRGLVVMVSDLNRAGKPTGFGDADLARWRDILAHLPDYPVSEAFGRKMFRWSEDDLDPFAVGGWHWNLLQVYPAHQISMSSAPALVQAADNALVLRPEVLGRGGPYCEYFAIFVRLGHYAPEILERLNWFLTHSPGKMGPSNFAVQGGNVECVAIVDEIHNFLLQSHEGFLRFFPAWHHNNAAFTGIRAMGAFIVSAEKRDGVCRAISVRSEKGQRCAVLNPWPGHALEIQPAVAVAVEQRSYGEVCAFPTEPGCSYTLTPRGGFPDAAPWPNLALGKPVTVSSAHDPRSRDEKPVWAHPTHVRDNNPLTWRAANLTDGNRQLCSLLTENMGWCSVPSSTQRMEWVTVDLGTPQTIRQVNLWPVGRGDMKYGRYDKEIVAMDHSYDGFPLDFKIMVSADGTAWQTVIAETNFLKMPAEDAKPKDAVGPESFRFAPCAVRYVKVECSRLRKSRYFGKHTMQLAEVEVLR